MTWRSIPEMLFQKYDHSAIELGGKLYTIGGRLRQDIKSKIKKCEVFDPKKDAWTEIGQLPEPLCSPVTFAHKDSIFCATGSSASYFNEGESSVDRRNLQIPNRDEQVAASAGAFALRIGPNMRRGRVSRGGADFGRSEREGHIEGLVFVQLSHGSPDSIPESEG